MTEGQLARIRYQFAQLRRTHEWQIVRQFCTAEASEDQPEWAPLAKVFREELDVLVTQEIEAAKHRAGK